MSHSRRWLVIWNLVVTALLIAAVAASTSPAQADVSVFSSGPKAPLDDGGDGSSATTDDIIDSTIPDALVTVTTTGLSDRHTHICLVTASAAASFLADGVFIFGLSLDGAASTVSASDRRIEMFNNPDINDDSFEEVSTTLAFPALVGDHSFTFSARKSLDAGGNLNVAASSMTVVCMRKDL